MRRPILLLAASLGLLTASLTHATAARSVDSCDECLTNCNQIPMDTQDCLQLYCPECADSPSSGG